MKRLRITVLSLCLMAALGGCADQGVDPDPADPSSISFTSFSVGQKSRYLHWTGTAESYRDEQGLWQVRDELIHYTQDTLVIEIISATRNGFDAVEYYSSQTTTTPMSGAIINDCIVFSGYTKLIGIFSTSMIGHRPLPLQYIAGPEIVFSAWNPRAVPAESFAQGCIRHYTQLGKQYLNLNVIIDNTAMRDDGEGSTVIYSRKHGVVRAIARGQWGTEGWDLL